ncbi:MAG: hypothetical protein OEW42_17315 [Acidimicrobiia bacterium]|nr:hypothetical protein [Acidimicrobiia bacterium]MDH5237883.1 hypothetical protein [Acidimicrobiia bacterium]
MPQGEQGGITPREATHRGEGFRTVFWWIVLILALVVMDDLTYGPVFWVLGQWAGPVIAAGTAFSIYVVVQLWIVNAVVSDSPNRLVRWLVDRLDLARGRTELATREQSLRTTVVGSVSAVLVSPLLGGVLPPVLLFRSGFSPNQVRRVAVPCAIVYAAEFALLHGALPARLF